MEKTKLIELLKTFDVREMRRMDEFCNSVYFNTNKALSRLFAQLKKAHPKFQANAITKETVFKKVFPGQKYSDQRMRDLTSDLFKLTEQFLAVQLMEADSFQTKRGILKRYETGSLTRYFDAAWEETKEHLAKNRNGEYFYHLFLLDSMMMNRIEKLKINTEGKPHKKLKEISFPYHVANAWLLQQKLHLHFVDLDLDHHPEGMKPLEVDFALYEKLLGDSGEFKTYLEPHLQLIRFMVSKDEQLFLSLTKSIAAAAIDLYSKEEQLMFFKVLINFCARETHKGHDIYHYYKRQLLQLLVQKKLHIENGEIDPVLFENIVLQSIIGKDLAEATQFIADNQHLLNVAERKNTVNYCQANINYELRDFHAVLRNLAAIDQSTFHAPIVLRIIQIKCHYELGSYETVFSCLDTFRRFLKDNVNIAAYRREPYLKFVNFLKILIGFKVKSNPKDKAALIRFRDSIESESYPQNFWLLWRTNDLLTLFEGD